MNEHDKMVLDKCRNMLLKGKKGVMIGCKVVSRKKIVSTLVREFPDRNIGIMEDF